MLKLRNLIEGFQGDNDNANDGMSGFRGNSTKQVDWTKVEKAILQILNKKVISSSAIGRDIIFEHDFDELTESIIEYLKKVI